MSNRLKRKSKKGKTVNLGEYTITLPAGTMTESFKKYLSETPYTTNRVADFLDAHSNRVRQKVESGQSFSQREVNEMCEFYKYFMENYTDDEGYVDNDIAELYEEKPYILQVIESFLDYTDKMETSDFWQMSAEVEQREAGRLAEKILSTGKNLIISGVTPAGPIFVSLLEPITSKDYDDNEKSKKTLSCACAALIRHNGVLIVSVISNEGKTKIFGISGTELREWHEMNKKEVEQYICIDDDGNYEPLDDDEEIVGLSDILKN